MPSADERLEEFSRIPGTASNLLSFQAFFDSIQTPDGFTRTQDILPPWGRNNPAVHRLAFERADDIRIEIHMTEEDVLDDWQVASGHVSYAETPGSSVRYTFDRRGVGDSFYVGAEETAAGVAVKIAVELERVEASRDRHRASVPVPGLPGGWTVTPEGRAAIAERLREKGNATFMPSGFGTGYTVTVRQPRGRLNAKRLPVAFRQFFGVSQAWYVPFDAD